MKKPNKVIFIIQAIFTIIGAASSLLMLKRVLVSNPDVLTLLSSILFVIDYLFIIVYSLYNYKKDDAHYKIAVYAYAALLGIEILYSGKFMQGFGLGDLETLIVNACNLFCFASVIKFAENLSDRKKALVSMAASVLVKFLVEFWLIFKMLQNIQLIHVITALSIPILGTTILLSFTYRYGND